MIEPVKEYFDELVENYRDFPKIIKINRAVHMLKKTVEIHRISPNSVNNYPDWVKGIASLDAAHHKKTNIASKDIISETVVADTLMNILNQNPTNKKLDYFQVDTEGFDYEVIKMIDFDCIKPTIIKYESVNLMDDEKNNLELLLENQGYFVFTEFGDSIAVNLNKIKLFS